MDALRGRGSFGISSSSAEEFEVSDGTEDRGEAFSRGGSSGMQCEVVFVRIAIGRSMAVVKGEGEEEERELWEGDARDCSHLKVCKCQWFLAFVDGERVNCNVRCEFKGKDSAHPT